MTAMRVFVEVVDRGSLTLAAETLDISRAMVSRYLATVEQWLGARLLHRTTRRLSLTDAGEAALPRVRQMLELSTEVEAVSAQRRSDAVGRLRIAASLSFAQAQLTAALADFHVHHPRVRIELYAMDRVVNLIEERIDLAVRITNELDSGLVARRLADCRSVICASPAYLSRRGTPRSVDDLRQHDCLTHAFGIGSEYRLQHGGRTITATLSGPMHFNETALLREAALCGAGIAMLPTYYVVGHLQRGELVRVLPDHEPEVLGVHAVYLSRQHQPQALRLLIDYLAQRFGSGEAPWDVELARQPAAVAAQKHRSLRRSSGKGT